LPARTLIIEPAGGLWGSERALLDLVDAAPGIDFAVCCPGGTPLIAELELRGVRVLPWFIARLHEKSRWHRLLAALGVLRACLAFRPEVIHLNQSGAYRVCQPAARLLGLKLVSHVRIFEDAAYLAGCRPRAERLQVIIAISHAIADEIASFDQLAAIPVVCIYDAFAPAPPMPDVERVPGRIACVGRITPIKGQDVLIEAMTLAHLLPKDIECLMIGDGDPDYVARIQSRGPASVRWSGFVENVPRLLASCAVLVCPSHREPLGRVVLEAWAAGAVPVVFAGSGGAAEVVAAADGGIIYREQTPTSLVEALATALALSPAEANRLTANGRAWLKSNCAPEPYGRALATVLAGHGSP
jgi:glycosyltransferase involved in cell wall biosynthesis